MQRQVSVVILNYRTWQHTVECVDRVMRQEFASFRIVVVDNDSRDGSADRIDSALRTQGMDLLRLSEASATTGAFEDRSVTLIESDSNRGYAAGNNVGIRWAMRGGDRYVLLLNSDTVVEPGFLSPLVDVLERHPNAAMAGPIILDREGRVSRDTARRRPGLGYYFMRLGPFGDLFPENPVVKYHYYLDEDLSHEPREVDILSGCCMLIRTSVLGEMGLLDEGTFLYYEEFILHERLRAMSLNAYVVPESSVVHVGSVSAAKLPSVLRLRYRNDSLGHYLTRYRKYPALVRQAVLLGPRLHYGVSRLLASLNVS